MFLITIPPDVALKLAKELIKSWIFLGCVGLCGLIPWFIITSFGGGFLFGAFVGAAVSFYLWVRWILAVDARQRGGKSTLRCHLVYGALIAAVAYATYSLTPPPNFTIAQRTRAWWDEFLPWRAAIEAGQHSPELIAQTYKLRAAATEVDSKRLAPTWLSRAIPVLDFNRSIHQRGGPDAGDVITFKGSPITLRVTQLEAIRDTLFTSVPEDHLPLYFDLAPTIARDWSGMTPTDLTGTPVTVHHIGWSGLNPTDPTGTPVTLPHNSELVYGPYSLKRANLPELQIQCQTLFNHIRRFYRLRPYECIHASDLAEFQALAYAGTDIRNLTSLFYLSSWRKNHPDAVCPPNARLSALPQAEQDAWIDRAIDNARKQGAKARAQGGDYLFSWPTRRDNTHPALTAFPFTEPPPFPPDILTQVLTPRSKQVPPEELRHALLEEKFAPWVK